MRVRVRACLCVCVVYVHKANERISTVSLLVRSFLSRSLVFGSPWFAIARNERGGRASQHTVAHEYSQPVSRNPGGSVGACDPTGTGAHRCHIRTARLRALQLLLSDAAQHERSFLSQALELLLFIACAIAWLGSAAPRGPVGSPHRPSAPIVCGFI